MESKKILIACFVASLLLVSPFVASAVSGTKAGGVKVKTYAKLGGDWFRVSTKHADSHGVLELKNVIPGWYKMVIDSRDVKSGQTLVTQIRMRDRDGKRIKRKTDVDVYVKVNDKKVLAATYESDKSGWIEMAGVTSETKYYLDVSEANNSSLSEKENCPRIKVKAKIDKSDWFRALYKRTDENKVLTIKNVLPGKYKFSYKRGDRSIDEPFTLHIRMIDEKGKKIREATDVNLYAYVNKVRVPVGVLKTDSKGWVTIPGVMTKMKYKIELDD
ncbi:MAG: hypothetical protein U9M90_03745 [Patescibacteria group bacterium]|nr:hypothetical protein [Patescibacteria group bacterium]